MAKKKRVPEIRFEGFDGDWGQRKLGEVAEIARGERFTAADYVSESGIPCIHYGEIYTSYDAIATSTISQVRKELYPSLRFAEPGDVIVAGTSENVEDVCKAVAWLGNTQVAYHDDSFAISFGGDPVFLTNFFQTKGFSSSKAAVAHGVKVMRVSREALSNILIPTPALHEQQTIATLFRDLDDLIALHQRKHEKLCKAKTALLGKMFPKPGSDVPELRFPGFTDPWEQREFGSIAALSRGLTYSPACLVDASRGVRVLRSSNINEDSFELHDDDVFVREDAVNIENCRDGDILITAANGSSRLVGKRAIIAGLTGRTVHGGFMLRAKTCEPDFLNASMGSKWYRQFLGRGVSGGNGALGNLDKKALEKCKLMLPGRDERDAIGAFFRDLDDLIALHQRKLEMLRKVKKSLLEKMFV